MQSVKESNNNWNSNSKLRLSSWCSQDWKERRRNPFLIVWLCVTERSVFVPPKIFSWTLAYLPHSVNGGALDRKSKALVCILRPALVLSGVLKRLWACFLFKMRRFRLMVSVHILALMSWFCRQVNDSLMILVLFLPVCLRCPWPRARASNRLWSSLPGNWRCLEQRSKEHFVWTVRPITQLPLPWAAKVSERWACGMAGTWFGINRHSCSLESFCSSAEGGALG